MARVSCGRGALAVAFVGAFASSAEATEWRSGVIVERGSAAQMDPGDTLRVSGDNAIGIRVAPRASFDAEGVSIIHDGAGRAPDHAYGILALQGAGVSLAGSRIDLRGRRTIGIRAQQGAAIELRDTTVSLSGGGDDSAALALAGGTVTLRGSSIDAGRGYALGTHFTGGGTAHVISQDSTIRGRIASGDTTLDMFADGGRIDGDIAREGAGALTLRMRRGAWRGQASRLNSLSLENSTWTVTADSDVAALRMGGGGHVGFDRAGKGFGTLRVGTWQADAGAGGIELGSRLDAGGLLRRQATDRLLVAGDASGTTPVHVVNVGGLGAPTSGRDGVNGPADGISLIQVGGQAEPGSFLLAGDYVAVGPWQYRLHAYEPGRSDPDQRLVDGKGADFWDFRLQSENVEDPDSWRHGGARYAASRRAALLPQVPAYLVMTHALLGYGALAVETWRRADPGDGDTPAMHLRAFGGSVAYRSTLPFNAYGFDYTRHDRGLQIAGDLLVQSIGESTLRAGLAASLGGTRVTPRAVDGRGEARVDARGLALNASLVTDSEWRMTATYSLTHYRVDVRTPSRGEVLGRQRANGNDVALAAGHRWQAGSRVSIEPGASLTWQRLRYSRASDGDGIELAASVQRRLSLRGGLRASLMFEPRDGVLYAWAPYVDVRYIATHDAGGSISLSGERFETGRAGRGAELSIGANFQLWSNVTAHVAAARRMRVGRSGESGLTARAGVAMAF